MLKNAGNTCVLRAAVGERNELPPRVQPLKLAIGEAELLAFGVRLRVRSPRARFYSDITAYLL